MKTVYTQHELSAAFPVMSESDYQSLKGSIEVSGVLNAITIYEGQVIDGWHRYQAANELGINCPEQKLEGWIDPKDYVRAQNKNRRHLTEAALALCEVSINAWRPSGASRTGDCQSPVSKTVKDMADSAGVSERTIQRAKVVQESAAPEILDAVKRGDIGLSKAVAIAKLPRAEQAAAINKPLPKPALAVVKQEEPEDDDHGLTDDQLIAEMRETQEENAQLQERVAIMAKDDKAAEIDKLLTRIAGLEGRLKQQAMQIKTATDGEKYHASVIHKLRKLLGVDTHKEIIASVTALAANRRAA